MRASRALLLLLLVLGACKQARPIEYGPPPVLTGDAEAQCKQTEPRVLPCADELFPAMLSAALGSDIGSSKPSSEEEARALHLTSCLDSSRDFAYMKDLVACWNEQGCPAFASCVARRTPKL